MCKLWESDNGSYLKTLVEFSFLFMKKQILGSDEFVVMAEGEKLAPADLL